MRGCFLLALLLAAASGAIVSVAASESRGSMPNVAVTLETVDLAMDDMSGRRWTVEGLRGRVVLLDFWATWCAPCLSELPRLKSLRERYSRDELEIIGIMLEPTTRRSLTSWLNRHRIDWPQVHERGYSGTLARAYGVQSLPATVLFRRDGSLDARNLRGDRLERRVTELINREDRR